jgi:transposase-like protein
VRALASFVAAYEPKYPKAVASLTRDHDKLLTFYDLPTEHWRHLRTTGESQVPRLGGARGVEVGWAQVTPARRVE